MINMSNDPRLLPRAYVHTNVHRMLNKTATKTIMGPKFMQKLLDGRVQSVQMRERKGKSTNLFHRSFLLHGDIRNVTLPLSQVKNG